MSTEFPHRPFCLIVEDQALIAMSIEMYLEEAGIAVQTVAQARAWLETNKAAIVILDLMLEDGPATELAGELNRRDIPFVIYTGYPLRKGMPAEFEGVPWLEKPTRRDDLLKVLPTLLVSLPPQEPSHPVLHS